jgi:hypothetical protein
MSAAGHVDEFCPVHPNYGRKASKLTRAVPPSFYWGLKPELRK